MVMKREPTFLFSDLADLWIRRLAPELKASSEARYRNILNCHLLPEFGRLPVSSITRDLAEEFRLKLLWASSGRDARLSPLTVAAILSTFKRLMSFARRDLGLQAADMSALTVRQTQKPFRVFTREEQRAISRYVMEYGNLTDHGVLLSLYTGLRIGEVCALRWKSISLETQSIHVENTMQRVQSFREKTSAWNWESDPANLRSRKRRNAHTQIVITEPKSASSKRSIPLPDALTNVLQRFKASPDSYFLTGTPDRFVEPRTLENHFVSIMEKCGIQGATFHTLRHTFATRCIEMGFDMKSLSEILGYANINITLNRYVHPSMEFKRENMSKVSNLFLQDMGTDPGK